MDAGPTTSDRIAVVREPELMKKIELMVIGAQKAGTTSLSNYLGEHPSLRNPLCMEFTFFSDPTEQRQGLQAFMDRFFPSADQASVHLIAKMSNLYRYRKALELLHAHFPACHLAFIVRDPVQRAYSAYRMACYDGWMTYDQGYMERLLRDGRPGDELYDLFVGYGLYAASLETVWEIFPKEQVHVFRFEDLKRDPQRVCDVLFRTLGVGPHTLKAKDKVHNETVQARSSALASAIHWMRHESNPIKRAIRSVLPYPVYLRLGGAIQDANRSNKAFPPMEPHVQAEWGAFYREHDARLAAMIGADLSTWTSQRSV